MQKFAITANDVFLKDTSVVENERKPPIGNKYQKYYQQNYKQYFYSVEDCEPGSQKDPYERAGQSISVYKALHQFPSFSMLQPSKLMVEDKQRSYFEVVLDHIHQAVE